MSYAFSTFLIFTVNFSAPFDPLPVPPPRKPRRVDFISNLCHPPHSFFGTSRLETPPSYLFPGSPPNGSKCCTFGTVLPPSSSPLLFHWDQVYTLSIYFTTLFSAYFPPLIKVGSPSNFPPHVLLSLIFFLSQEIPFDSI